MNMQGMSSTRSPNVALQAAIILAEPGADAVWRQQMRRDEERKRERHVERSMRTEPVSLHLKQR